MFNKPMGLHFRSLVLQLAFSASQLCQRPDVLTVPIFMCLSRWSKGISAFLQWVESPIYQKVQAQNLAQE